MSIPRSVTVCEMGPRDGLQNEHTVVSPADKVRYIDLLSDSGLPLVEVTSFVSPKAIPQLADAQEVFARIKRRPGVRYPVLTPNLRGLERAKAAGADAIAVFTAASEPFTRRNINMTIEESIETFRDVVRNAKANNMWVRGYVSTAFGSPPAAQQRSGDFRRRGMCPAPWQALWLGRSGLRAGSHLGRRAYGRQESTRLPGFAPVHHTQGDGCRFGVDG
jgi:hydroxymethylglutaryl-CoA lyase